MAVHPGVRRILVCLPWLGVAIATTWSLAARDAAAAGLLQCAYVGFAVAIPGAVMVHAAVPGRFGFAELLGLGTSFGLAWEVVGWVTLSALRADELILAWPVLTVALLVALPTTRRRLRSAKPRRLRLAWHWG